MASLIDVVMLKCRKIFPTGNRRNRALFTLKKQNFGSRAPKICQTFGSQFSRFHPNRFTFGGVIADRVKAVLWAHWVGLNPWFAWSDASLRANDNCSLFQPVYLLSRLNSVTMTPAHKMRHFVYSHSQLPTHVSTTLGFFRASIGTATLSHYKFLKRRCLCQRKIMYNKFIMVKSMSQWVHELTGTFPLCSGKRRSAPFGPVTLRSSASEWQWPVTVTHYHCINI